MLTDCHTARVLLATTPAPQTVQSGNDAYPNQ